MNPRVLFVDHAAVLSGAELHLIDAAAACGDRCEVLLFQDGPLRARLEAQHTRVRIVTAPRGLLATRRDAAAIPWRTAWDTLALARVVARRARDFDLIHANSQKAFVVSAIAGRLARRPVVWQLHDLLDVRHMSAGMIRLDVRLARHATARVLANSHATAAALAHQGGPADRIRVVYNGIDPDPFDRVTPTDVAGVRQALDVGDAPLIALFGRLAPWKGQRTALRALRSLPDAHLMIVGDALFGETGYADSLAHDAEHWNVADRVHFLGFRSDVPRLMAAADVVVHTSTAPEPFGRVLVEAMLARRPLIASEGGGVEEIVTHGVNGTVVPPEQPLALAAAIRDVWHRRDRTGAMVRAARDTATVRFSVAAMADAMQREHLAVVRR